MGKARTLEAKLEEMRQWREAPPSPERTKALRAALAASSNFLAAEAAEIVGTAKLTELIPEMKTAFDRFMEDGEETDKQCRAKSAILEALNDMEFDEEAFWWKGARYRQPEPVWGGSQDTAAPIRVACAFALVRIRSRTAMPHLVDLLCDPEKPARIGAVQALAYAGSEAAAWILRLKIRLGDKEPEVVGECFASLISLAPKEGVALTAEFLDSEDEAIQELAVLALGESRLPEGFERLKTAWRKAVETRLRETLLTAIGLLRLAEGVDFLVETVATEDAAAAKAAVSALAIHRHDERVRERTLAALEKNGRGELRAHFAEAFSLDEARHARRRR